jgi:hypothetical protein
VQPVACSIPACRTLERDDRPPEMLIAFCLRLLWAGGDSVLVMEGYGLRSASLILGLIGVVSVQTAREE